MALPCKFIYNGKEYSEKEFKELILKGEFDKDLSKELLLPKDSGDITTELKTDNNGKDGSQKDNSKESTDETNGESGSKEGDGKEKVKKEGVAEPPTGETTPLNEVDEDSERYASVRKEKLKEIEIAKDLFEKQSKIKWSETYKSALENVQKMFPNKSLYEAMKARVNELAIKLNKKELYNPTSEDIAVFNVLRAETNKRIDDVEGLDSDNSVMRDLATAELENYKADLDNIVRVTNQDGEKGRAFNMLRSEVNTDSGLKIRRMELTKSNGGEKLSSEQEGWLKDRWEEEKALLQQENELKTESMKQDFDNKLADLQKQYEEKLKETTKNTSENKTVKEKTLSQKGKDVANKIRNLKKPKGSTNIDFTLGTWDLAVEGIAKLVEAGSTVAEAIEKLVKDGVIGFKELKDKDNFEGHLSDWINKKDKTEQLEKIKIFSEENNVTDITNDMVAKNLIRDYVNSHIGEVEQKDILDAAYKDLKSVLPNATKENLIGAYLKENEYKQPTKKDLEGGLKQAQKELTSIAKLTEDIEDLNNLKEVRKRNFSTPREKSEYEKKLFDEKKDKLKSLSEQKRKIDKEEKDAQKKKDKLAELDANIERAKRDLDLIKTYKDKSETKIDEDIAAKEKELKKAINDNSSEDRVQAKKLESEKENVRKKIKEFNQKLADGEFIEPEPITLKKQDAELIRLKKQLSTIEEQYRKKQKELEEKNKGKLERSANFLRSAYVTTLIWKFGTLAKVATMSALRPLSESTRKLVFGKTFDLFFPNISEAAKHGGESSSLRSIKKGFEAYFGQMGEKRINAKYEIAEKEYKEASKAYKDYKESSNPNDKKLEQLKNNMNDKLIKTMGSFIYKFIGGSSVKDAMSALVNRANEIEKQFGHIKGESIKDGNLLDKSEYVLGFIGRSHSALKTFSGRFSFAAGFMARLEGAVKAGEDISKGNKILEIAHESYLDWERGKYQQSNLISDYFNDMINNADRGKTGNELKAAKVAKFLLKWDVPITRVPVNILHEAVVEYTFGLVKSAYIANKEVRGIKRQLKSEGVMPNEKGFKDALKERISQMDAKQAATIVRCFTKGGLSAGLYALAAISGAVHFGIFPHKGQKKHKEEDELQKDELNPGQIMLGDDKYGETLSSIIEHTPALWETFMGLGIAQAYNDDIKKGKTSKQAAEKAIYMHLKIVESGIPQLKLIQSLQDDVTRSVLKNAENLGILEPPKKKH